MAIAQGHLSTSLADHGRRLAAAALDLVYSLLVICAFTAIGFGVGLAAAGGSSGDDGWEALGWVLLGTGAGLVTGVVVWTVLTVWLVRRPGTHNGQTLGKQTLRIRAVRAGGGEIEIGIALLREILVKGMLIGFTSSLVSTLLGFIDAGVVGALVAVGVWYGPALFDEQRRALHDRMCATRVVLARRRAAPAAPLGADELWPATP
jgi:uncharacterized RDD family membrane protein YckC